VCSENTQHYFSSGKIALHYEAAMLTGAKMSQMPNGTSVIERPDGMSKKLWAKRWMAQLQEFVPLGVIRQLKLNKPGAELSPEVLQRLVKQLSPKVRDKMLAALDLKDGEDQASLQVLDDSYIQSHVVDALQVGAHVRC
jgi:hypothetical protein